jgi:hypothetical protein
MRLTQKAEQDFWWELGVVVWLRQEARTRLC